MTTFTITKTMAGSDSTMFTQPGDVVVSVDKRTPARSYSIAIPVTLWPVTEDVPAHYRALVNSALLASAEAILKQYLDSTNRDQTSIPCALFTLETLTARSVTSRMTSDLLLGLWKQTRKYVLSIAPKLTELTGSKLLAYKSRLELHEKRLSALTTKSPETKLSNADLDKILVNMDESDFDTDYGSYIAERVEVVRSKLAEDSDAL